MFFFPFYNVNYKYEQLFKIFRSGQKQQTTQNTARATMLKADWFKNDITHVLKKNGIATGESGDIYFSHLATIRYTTVFHIIYVIMRLPLNVQALDYVKTSPESGFLHFL